MLSLLTALGSFSLAETAEPTASIDAETLRHFQALVRMDTADPPGREEHAVAYLREVLEAEGIKTQTFATEAHRPNLVARLKGDGTKQPVLLMGHTDTVNVDPEKWIHPPFSADLADGYVYGRGTLDDKDNVVASLMTLLLLKRADVKLQRDVIFLAESGEEGSTRVGIKFMVDNHFDAIDAEYCLAEGGGVARQNGRVLRAGVATTEKIPRAITLSAKGPAGHGSVPLQTNAIAHLAAAVSALANWQIPIRLNETTTAYFKRLSEVSPPEQAQRYADVLHPEPAIRGAADRYFQEHEPLHASMLRSSMSPTIIEGGYRVNVIPSVAKATIDTRLEPSEDAEAFLEQAKKVVNDPSIDVAWAPRDIRPAGVSPLGTEAFATIGRNVEKHYGVAPLPMMLTGGTDMAYLRARGVSCYGIGPAVDMEDGPKGFGPHSDQERILESELYRFVRFQYDVVLDLAAQSAE